MSGSLSAGVLEELWPECFVLGGPPFVRAVGASEATPPVGAPAAIAPAAEGRSVVVGEPTAEDVAALLLALTGTGVREPLRSGGGDGAVDEPAEVLSPTGGPPGP